MLKNQLSRAIQIALAALVIYIFTQNVLKWIPFHPGSTAFKLSTLQENLVSVISSLALFVIIALTLARPIKAENQWRFPDYWAGGFFLILLLQILLRDSKTEELIRSLALIGSIGSSILVAKYFSQGNDRLEKLFFVLKWALLASVALGFSIAVIKPEVADWGGFAGAQCLGKMFCRTELFFFTINPLFLVVMLFRNTSPSRRSFLLQLLAGVFILLLAFTTRTRQFTLPLFASSVLIFLLWAKQRKKILYVAGAVTAIAVLFYGPTLLRTFLEYTRIVVEPSAIAVDARAADWTSGRGKLLELLLKTFKENPILGVGGVEIRAIIGRADLIARTEHGFLFYLAAYGVFGLLFIGYIFQAFIKSLHTISLAMRGLVDSTSPHVTVAIIAMTLIPFGFVGIFGSATNPTDWFALVFVALISQASIEKIQS